MEDENCENKSANNLFQIDLKINDENLIQGKTSKMPSLNVASKKFNSFQEAIYPVIALGQIFAQMPISGISSKNPTDLTFKFKSFKFLYFIIFFTALSSLLTITVAGMVVNHIEFGTHGPLIFYATNFIATICFFDIAKKWPKLMVQWNGIDKEIPSCRTKIESNGLYAKIKLITFVHMIFALVEHILFIASGAYRAYRCVYFRNPVESFFSRSFSLVWPIISYSLPTAIVIQVIHLYLTFTWNFTDLFIIVISVGLSTQLKQINDNMNVVKYQVVPEIFWETHRNYYQNFCDLLESVDKALAWLIMLSFTNNLYSTCMQLSNIVQPTGNLVHATYFWFSLTFLMTRTFAVPYFAANIYEESRKPISIFRNVPKTCYNIEVKRFFQQIVHNKIALTGKNYFHINRHLMLKIAGTIVTYEIVVLQFSVGHNVQTNIDELCG